jgi:uncharacterized protein (TIGR02145 family)
MMKKTIACLLVIITIAACKKTELPVQQNQESEIASSASKGGGGGGSSITTDATTIITSATATSGGTIPNGGKTVTERGICYSTSSNPTTANNKVVSGSGTGSFISIMYDLSANTTYYVRAYAIRSTGTTYGNQISFSTYPSYGTVTDYDGNVYNTITIGTQVWTVENLKTTKYRDGTPIPNVTDNTDWYNLSTGAYCNYNNDEANVATYGRLYNWYAVNDARNLAPAGWHVASYNDVYNTLFIYLGGSSSQAGKKLKDNVFWNGDNSSGFKALPAGRRYSGDYMGPITHFSAFNTYGDWWTSTTTSNPDLAWYLEQGPGDGGFSIIGTPGNLNYSKKTGYSVRLVRD